MMISALETLHKMDVYIITTDNASQRLTKQTYCVWNKTDWICFIMDSSNSIFMWIESIINIAINTCHRNNATKIVSVIKLISDLWRSMWKNNVSIG